MSHKNPGSPKAVEKTNTESAVAQGTALGGSVEGTLSEGDQSVETVAEAIQREAIRKVDARLSSVRLGEYPSLFKVEALEPGCLLDGGLRNAVEMCMAVLELAGVDHLTSDEREALEDYEFLNELEDDAIDALNSGVLEPHGYYIGYEDGDVFLSKEEEEE